MATTVSCETSINGMPMSNKSDIYIKYKFCTNKKTNKQTYVIDHGIHWNVAIGVHGIHWIIEAINNCSTSIKCMFTKPMLMFVASFFTWKRKKSTLDVRTRGLRCSLETIWVLSHLNRSFSAMNGSDSYQVILKPK